MAEVTLTGLVRASTRSATLHVILSELKRYRSLGIDTRIVALADRPTDAVRVLLEKHSTPHLFCPFPLVSPEGGERFMEGQNLLLSAALGCYGLPDWFMFCDDDRWLEPEHANVELLAALTDDSVDMWYANSIFMQDAPNKWNPGRHHHSPLLFRALEHDRYPLNRMIEVTEQRFDDAVMSGRTGTLKTPLLDYGTFTSTERARVHQMYTQAGKIDAYTAAMVAPAQLALFPDDAVAAGLLPCANWRDLWTENCS